MLSLAHLNKRIFITQNENKTKLKSRVINSYAKLDKLIQLSPVPIIK